MNDTKIASKAKAQLANFMGKVFTHFSKPGQITVSDVKCWKPHLETDFIFYPYEGGAFLHSKNG